MEIDFIKSREEWDGFLLENRTSFLQSFSWGEFKKEYQKVERIEARKEGKIRGVCQFFEEKMPFGNYFYIPHGPVAKEKEVREKLFLETVEIGKRKGMVFVKTEPVEKITVGEKSFRRIQPRKTLISDITGSPEEILKSFRKTMRHNVRNSREKGVVVEKGSISDLKHFFNLLLKTQKRQKFTSYDERYFKRLLKEVNSDLILAKHKGEIAAAVILVYFGTTVTFLHSTFDYTKKDLNATALLRFESVKFAKEKGCTSYDFWGIDEKRFPGVTVFKKGFGGEEFVYPEGRDIPIKKIPYICYRLAEGVRSKVRNR